MKATSKIALAGLVSLALTGITSADDKPAPVSNQPGAQQAGPADQPIRTKRIGSRRGAFPAAAPVVPAQRAPAQAAKDQAPAAITVDQPVTTTSSRRLSRRSSRRNAGSVYSQPAATKANAAPPSQALPAPAK